MIFAGSLENTRNTSLRVSPILVATGYRCFLVWLDLVMPFIIHQPAKRCRPEDQRSMVDPKRKGHRLYGLLPDRWVTS
jgi:hypothetical protein